MSATTQVQHRIHAAAMRLFAQQSGRQPSVSELAAAAGVTRGTIYNHITSTSQLFEQLVSDLTGEMNGQISQATMHCSDPALRLALGIRLYIRRGYKEPDWGLFITTFAFNSAVMKTLWAGQPAQDLQAGMATGRFSIGTEQLPSALALIGSAVIAGMHICREGLRTWRESGSDTSRHVLCALGMPAHEASILAQAPLLPSRRRQPDPRWHPPRHHTQQETIRE